MNHQDAYRALRTAGLKHADPDLARLFDITDPDFVAKAKAAKPDLFVFDARTATKEEVAAGWKQLNAAEAKRLADRQAARGTPNFDARTATAAEVAAECRRRGW